MHKHIRIVIFSLLVSGVVVAQSENLAEKSLLKNMISRPAYQKKAVAIESLYNSFQFQLLWVGRPEAARALLQLFDSTAALCLPKAPYADAIAALQQDAMPVRSGRTDSMEMDVKISAAAIQFLTDVAYGRPPETGYNGITYTPPYTKAASLLAVVMSTGNIPALLQQAEPAYPEYRALKTAIALCLHDTTGKLYRARLAGLKEAINTVRWLRGLREQHESVIVVNIPSTTLLVYSKSTVTLSSKVIVGKLSTRTPLLCSQVFEVVLYPYWMVPAKIASRELLPMIKRNPHYLEANSFQVLTKSGKIVNPATVNWHTLSPENFPYVIRQSTGCDNSLGLVKLNFISPYDVYLHDTPWKSLFFLNTRFFSHGCIRVEQAIELGRLLLGYNSIAIDTLTEKGCLRSQRPIPVPLDKKVPVCVLYNTAWVDSSATVSYYRDVYRRLR